VTVCLFDPRKLAESVKAKIARVGDRRSATRA